MVRLRLVAFTSCQVLPSLLASVYWEVLTAVKSALFRPPLCSGKKLMPFVQTHITPLLSNQMSPARCAPAGGPAVPTALRRIGAPVPTPVKTPPTPSGPPPVAPPPLPAAPVAVLLPPKARSPSPLVNPPLPIPP